MNPSPQYNQSWQSHGSSSRGNAFTRSSWELVDYIYLKILVSYLYNPPEEAIFKSSQTKEQLEIKRP